jgi:lipopolysaccharide/colanic/teichoic acid biosynthesis glycosyltransferase
VKRAIDILGALLLVTLLSPLVLLIALLTKLLSPGGPVFFVQTRVGYNRRPFRMIKFRSMIPNAEQLQRRSKSKMIRVLPPLDTCCAS